MVTFAKIVSREQLLIRKKKQEWYIFQVTSKSLGGVYSLYITGAQNVPCLPSDVLEFSSGK